MPAGVLSGVTLNQTAPEGMLPYDKNCVAMTFSRLLGVGVYATINFFIGKGWIARARDLENDGTVLQVIEKLGLTTCYEDTVWAIVKTGLKERGKGRYFAMNWGPNGSTAPNAQGHAFAIIKNGDKKGGWGVFGNNAEKRGRPYNKEIKDCHKISVYGPIA